MAGHVRTAEVSIASPDATRRDSAIVSADGDGASRTVSGGGNADLPGEFQRIGRPDAGDLPRPLGRADHRAQPAPEVPDAAAAPGDLRSPTPSDSGLSTAMQVRVGQNGNARRGHGPDQGAGRRRRRASWPRASPTATPTRLLNGGPVSVEDREAQRGPGLNADPRRHHLRRSDLDHGRQVARDLRGDLRHPAGADGGRAQADRPLPAPLRPQPGRPLRAPAAARRRRQADLQGDLPPAERDLRPCSSSARCCRSSPASWRWRSSPGATSRAGSGSTGSTSRSGSSTSSPSARSPSTACCSAAGPRARNTASSGRCARPRS